MRTLRSSPSGETNARSHVAPRAGVDTTALLPASEPYQGYLYDAAGPAITTAVAGGYLGPLDLQPERPGKLDAESNAAVSEWMRSHLRIATFACPDRSTLAALEHAVLDDLDPPLNLMGMSATATRKQLRALRRQLS